MQTEMLDHRVTRMTQEPTKTTILLADDHGVVRRGLRMLLEAEPDTEVIGETGDGLEALRLVERLKPTLLIQLGTKLIRR